MLVRLACCVVMAVSVLMPHGARAAGCADEISRLMSKDTEKLTTRYNRVTRQIQEKGASPKLLQEECRIARELGPRLEDQLAASPRPGPSVADDRQATAKRYNSGVTIHPWTAALAALPACRVSAKS